MPLFIGNGRSGDSSNWSFHAFILSTGLVSIGAQVFLFWMIVTKSPKPMHNFRFPLCMLTFWDCVFTVIIAVMIDPEVIFPLPGVIVIGVGQYVGENGGVILFCMALYTGAAIIGSQDYCLMYRYVCIQQRFPGLMASFTTARAIVANQLVGNMLCAAVAACGYFALVKHSTYTLALHCWCGSVCDNTTLWKLEAAVYDRLPLILLNTKDNIKAISVLLAVGFIGSELVSLGLALLIFRTLRKNVAFFSAKTYRMHVQMTTLIVLQLCTPIVCIVFPVTVAAFCYFFNVHIRAGVGELGIALIALDAPVSTFITIFFVTPFRRYTLGVFGVDRLLAKLGHPNASKASSTTPNNNNIQLAAAAAHFQQHQQQGQQLQLPEQRKTSRVARMEE